MAKVYLTRRIPEDGIKLLEERHEIEIYEGDAPPSKEEIIEKVRDKEGLLCLLTDPIDKDVFNAAPKLRAISTYAVGYDNIDMEEATRRKIPVSNTPGVLTETTADLTWALIMAIARRIVEGDRMVREGKFKGWGPMVLLGNDVYGKTLGIIGAGRIGQAVARRAKGFNMRIIYTSRERKSDFERECNAKFVGLDELLKESDYITLHVPLTEETYHLIGEKELKMMKNSAYLINTARGKCIDEKALVEALKNKDIAGAALDVFENEPLLTPGLAELDNVVLAPHAGSASIETRTKMAVIAAKNLIDSLDGKMPQYCLNPEVFEKQR
ncbi:MAG: D-glycerate dehydrogenase [Thermoplasmata archaeon]|nr:D-glycerate dehydrogenase [Thermoplasmata archaeon]